MTYREIVKNRVSSTELLVGAGYAPGHITCIFEIHKSSKNPLECGSRGVGFCINKGVNSIAQITKSKKQSIEVYLNNKKLAGETTKLAIKELIGNESLKIKIFSFSELPISSGFGLSGAGALSSVFAVDSALRLKNKRSDLVNAAHIAEVIAGTGLGDVVAQATGGFVLREFAGGIGIGQVKKLNLLIKNKTFLFGVLNEGLETGRIINNPVYIRRINRAASVHLENIQNMLTLENIFKQSYFFSKESKLIKKNVRDLIEIIHAKRLGLATMVMLGNTIVSIGNTNKIEKLLTSKCKTIKCKFTNLKAKKVQSLG